MEIKIYIAAKIQKILSVFLGGASFAVSPNILGRENVFLDMKTGVRSQKMKMATNVPIIETLLLKPKA